MSFLKTCQVCRSSADCTNIQQCKCGEYIHVYCGKHTSECVAVAKNSSSEVQKETVKMDEEVSVYLCDGRDCRWIAYVQGSPHVISGALCGNFSTAMTLSRTIVDAHGWQIFSLDGKKSTPSSKRMQSKTAMREKNSNEQRRGGRMASLETHTSDEKSASIGKTVKANGKQLKRKQDRMTTQGDAQGSRRSSRRRLAPKPQFEAVYEELTMSTKERQELQTAMAASQAQAKLPQLDEVPEAPVFYPTIDEFRDPIAYIKSIESEAVEFGICKIIPPKEWRDSVQCIIDFAGEDDFKFKTRTQRVDRLSEALGFEVGKTYSLSEYREMSETFKQEYFASKVRNHGPNKTLSEKDIEREYWRIVETSPSEVCVEYGNDVDTAAISGSGFEYLFLSPEEQKVNQESKDRRIKRSSGLISDADVERKYKGCQGWNLNVVSSLPGCPLRHVTRGVSGVNVPWLYIGMLFASFCWHNEDDYLHSMNYHHQGAPKTWYGIPGDRSREFEKVARTHLASLFVEEPDLLMKLVTQISPRLVMANGVAVCRTVQHAGEFVVTFPQAYHAGFSHGLNMAEAVNFATDNWFHYARKATQLYRKTGRQSVCPFEFLLLACVLNEREGHDMSILVPELEKSMAFDLNLRQMCVARGITVDRHVRTPGLFLRGLSFSKVDTTRPPHLPQCHLCKHYNYFSYLICIHCRQTYCLGHMHATCKCKQQDSNSMDHLALFYRFTAAEQLFVLKYILGKATEEEIVAMKKREETLREEARVAKEEKERLMAAQTLARAFLN